MLTHIFHTSSSCTGSYSGEMALSVVEKTVNKSGVLTAPIQFHPIRCHETLIWLSCVFLKYQIYQIKRQWVNMYQTRNVNSIYIIPYLSYSDTRLPFNKCFFHTCSQKNSPRIINISMSCCQSVPLPRLRKYPAIAGSSLWTMWHGAATPQSWYTQNRAFMETSWTCCPLRASTQFLIHETPLCYRQSKAELPPVLFHAQPSVLSWIDA